MTDYTLTRSGRKTAAIYLRDCSVGVRAPLKVPKRDIGRFVTFKEKRITDRLVKSWERSELRKAFAPSYGDTVPYRGRQYPTAGKNGNRIGFDGAALYMPPALSPERIKAACIQIYRMLVKRDLTEKTLRRRSLCQEQQPKRSL